MGPSSIDNRVPWLVEDSCLLTVIFFFFGGHKGGYRENERIAFMFLNRTILTEELGSILNE